MGAMASHITSLTIVFTTGYSGADQKKTSKLRVIGICVGIHRWPVNSPHKWPVTRKMLPFDDVIMNHQIVTKDTRFHTFHVLLMFPLFYIGWGKGTLTGQLSGLNFIDIPINLLVGVDFRFFGKW